jgi:hypothetical protein
MFQYRRPTECPQENRPQQITDTFSETPMARTEREAKLELATRQSMSQIFPQTWDSLANAASRDGSALANALASQDAVRTPIDEYMAQQRQLKNAAQSSSSTEEKGVE